MTDEIVLRASELPIAFKCPGSVRLPVVRVREDSDPARLGVAFHEAARAIVETGAALWEEIPAVAASNRSDEEDLRVLVSLALKMWPALAPDFPNATSELRFRIDLAPGVELSGHMDGMAVLASRAIKILDWKSGVRDSDYSQQMKGYMALALLDDTSLESAEAFVVWVRDLEVERYSMTREQARAWIKDLLATVVQWNGVFQPGAHCFHCKRSHECAAANALARRDAAAMLDLNDLSSIERMEPTELIALYRRARDFAARADRVKEAIRELVVARGQVNGDDGRLVVRQESRRELDVAKAWPVLAETQGFRDTEFAEVTKMSVSKVEKLIATRAGRGKGAAAVRALNETLTKAGALNTHTINKLTETR